MTSGRPWRTGAESPDPPFALAALALGAVAATRFFAIAASPGEVDEAIFSGAVTRFDLFDLSPQAPGFPVFILLGRALLPWSGRPFTALAILSTISAALLFPALYLWGRRLVGGWAALAGALVAASLPVVFVNGGRAFTDTPATALFLAALALLGWVEERLEARAGRPRVPAAAPIAAGLLGAGRDGVPRHAELAASVVDPLGASSFVHSG